MTALELGVVAYSSRVRLLVVLSLALAGSGCAKPGLGAPPVGFVRIEAGTFTMGVVGGDEDEQPEHAVTLSRDYFVQIHEVTRGEFRALLGTAPEPWGDCDDTCPVTLVNRYEAIEYANAKSRAEGLEPCYEIVGGRGKIGTGCKGEFGCGPGSLWAWWETDGYEADDVRFEGLACKGYRLPTEAEWEYAARAGRPAEEYARALGTYAWYEANGEGLHPVGKKTANPWGLHDMLGNAWEFVGDRYGPYPKEPATDPLGPPAGEKYVDRGGSYMNAPSRVTVTARLEGGQVGRNANCGFRLVRTAN